MEYFIILLFIQDVLSVGTELWPISEAPKDWCYKKKSCNHESWKYSCQQSDQSPINLPSNITLLAREKSYDKIYVSKLEHILDELKVEWRVSNFYATHTDIANHPAKLKWGNDEYIFDGIHFHYGAMPRYGSEHTIGQRAYAGEVHLVYYNAKKSNMLEAVKSQQATAIAIVAVLIDTKPPSSDSKEDIQQSNVLEKLMNTLKDCKPDDTDPCTTSKNNVDGIIEIDSLYPGRYFDYAYAYKGSLTNPPCTPVLWLVIRRPVVVKEKLLERYTTEITADDYRPSNFRPIQPRNGRNIRLAKIRYTSG